MIFSRIDFFIFQVVYHRNQLMQISARGKILASTCSYKYNGGRYPFFLQISGPKSSFIPKLRHNTSFQSQYLNKCAITCAPISIQTWSYFCDKDNKIYARSVQNLNFERQREPVTIGKCSLMITIGLTKYIVNTAGNIIAGTTPSGPWVACCTPLV